MALDKFKEHIAQDEEVKSEEVVAEETTTEEEFDQKLYKDYTFDLYTRK